METNVSISTKHRFSGARVNVELIFENLISSTDASMQTSGLNAAYSEAESSLRELIEKAVEANLLSLDDTQGLHLDIASPLPLTHPGEKIENTQDIYLMNRSPHNYGSQDYQQKECLWKLLGYAFPGNLPSIPGQFSASHAFLHLYLNKFSVAFHVPMRWTSRYQKGPDGSLVEETFQLRADFIRLMNSESQLGLTSSVDFEGVPELYESKGGILEKNGGYITSMDQLSSNLRGLQWTMQQFQQIILNNQDSLRKALGV